MAPKEGEKKAAKPTKAKPNPKTAKLKKNPQAASAEVDLFDLTREDNIVSHYLVKHKKKKKKPLKAAQSSTPTTSSAKDKKAAAALASFTPRRRRRRKEPRSASSATEKDIQAKRSSWSGKRALLAAKQEEQQVDDGAVDGSSSEKGQDDNNDNNKEKVDNTRGDALEEKKDETPTNPRWLFETDTSAATANKDKANNSSDLTNKEETKARAASKPRWLFETDNSGAAKKDNGSGQPTSQSAASPATVHISGALPAKVKKERASRKKKKRETAAPLDSWMPPRRKKSWISKKVVVKEEETEEDEEDSDDDSTGTEEPAPRPPPPISQSRSNAQPIIALQPVAVAVSSSTGTVAESDVPLITRPPNPVAVASSSTGTTNATATNAAASGIMSNVDPTALPRDSMDTSMTAPVALPAEHQPDIIQTSTSARSNSIPIEGQPSDDSTIRFAAHSTTTGSASGTDPQPPSDTIKESALEECKDASAAEDVQMEAVGSSAAALIPVGEAANVGNEIQAAGADPMVDVEKLQPMDDSANTKDSNDQLKVQEESRASIPITNVNNQKDSLQTTTATESVARARNNPQESQATKKRSLNDEGYLLYLASMDPASAPAPAPRNQRKKRLRTSNGLDNSSDESDNDGGGKIGAVRDLQRGPVQRTSPVISAPVAEDRPTAFSATPDAAPSNEVNQEALTVGNDTNLSDVKTEESGQQTSTDESPDPAPSNGDGPTKSTEDEVEWIATANETRLPHMRQHCTDYKFDTNQELSLNRKYCNLCYCYVCDSLVKDCKSWDSSPHALQNHCNADDNNTHAQYWKGRREAVQKEITDSNLKDLTRGEGPFEPDDQNAQKDPNLTRCRRCKWYNRFFHRNFRYFKNLHPVGFLDWCHKCGRVASEIDFGKEQSKPCVPQEGDIFVGTKQIPFRVVAHDPREMERYEDSWLEADEDSPEWQYDEGEMREDFFCHRFGKRPTLSMILASTSILKKGDMPSTGSFAVSGIRAHYIPTPDTAYTPEEREYDSRCGLKRNRFHYWEPIGLGDEGKPSVNETEGIHLTREGHLVLLQQISFFEQEGYCKRKPATERTEGKPSTLTYDITAEWDKKSNIGTFSVQLYIKPLTARFMPLSGPLSWNKLFGSWFDAFPIALSEVSGSLTAEEPSEYDEGSNELGDSEGFAAPPFSLTYGERRESVLAIWPTIQRAIQDHNSTAHAFRRNLCLESTQESKGLGGRSPQAAGFSNTLRRYIGEVFVEDVMKGQRGGMWVNRSRGIISSHRTIRRAGQGLPVGRQSHRRSDHHSANDMCYLRSDDRPLAFCMRDACESIYYGIRSMSSIIAHSENLGHEETRFVDGLNVELLQFQRQSVQWALERETVEGGVQSWLWPQLPYVVRPRKDPVYYNPILETWRTDKPRLVRGGIIAAEMGLGKTVISLALILVNPAPPIPESGALASELDSLDAGSTTWDKDLYSHTAQENPKIGRVLSRGTLVVCKVSLVGQWIEEAKSKLKDPGIVYPYHGSGRTRDPLVLSQKAIVVTTYETIKSDAVYHAQKSGSDNYVPPLAQVRWWRLICDESHSISQAGTEKSDALMALSADHKWLVSGTPIQTSLTDLKNQLEFLGIENVNDMFRLFRNTLNHTNDRAAKQGSARRRGHFFDAPAASGNNGQVDFGHFMFFLRTVFLRHSQQQRYRNTDDNLTLMELPEKTERSVSVEFSEEEREEYRSLEEAAQEFYTEFRRRHSKTLSTHFLKLASKLTQVRIACAGGPYPLDEKGRAEEDNEDGKDEEETPQKKKAKVVKFSSFAFKSKFNKLIEELKHSRDNDPTSKSLVFSQFTSSLRYLQEELPKHGFQFRTLSGDMPMRRRAKALSDFQHDPPTTIFLLSMRAGAMGINLTQANRVFLLEPCFNPALEAQSVGRVYRLGQKREVEVIRLVMEDSVESRMVEMLKRKYGDNADSDEEENVEEGAVPDAAAAARANNTMLGSVNNDKATVVAAEFDLLFGYQPPPEEFVPDVAASNMEGGFFAGMDEDEMFFDTYEDAVPEPVLSFPTSGPSKGSGRTSGLL